MKAATDHLFVPKHRHLSQGTTSVTYQALPSQPATLPDQLDVAVALSGVGVRRGARHHLGTAVDQGGMITAASGVCPATDR